MKRGMNIALMALVIIGLANGISVAQNFSLHKNGVTIIYSTSVQFEDFPLGTVIDYRFAAQYDGSTDLIWESVRFDSTEDGNRSMVTPNRAFTLEERDEQGFAILSNAQPGDEPFFNDLYPMSFYFDYHETDTLIISDTLSIPLYVNSSDAFKAIELSTTTTDPSVSLSYDFTDTDVSLLNWQYGQNDGTSSRSFAAAGNQALEGDSLLLAHLIVVPTAESDFSIITSNYKIDERNNFIFESDSLGFNVIQIPYGDVSYNGEVRAYDASLILENLIGTYEFNRIQELAADVTQDGTVSTIDANVILDYVVGNISEIPFNPDLPAINTSTSDGSLIISGDVMIPYFEFIIENQNEEQVKGYQAEFVLNPELIVEDTLSWIQDIQGLNINYNLDETHLSIAITGDIRFESIVFQINFHAFSSSDFDEDETLITLVRERWNEEAWIERNEKWTIADLVYYTSTDETEVLPTDFALSQNYPNPFNPSTMFNYALPNAAQVRLEVFNSLGQRVAMLVNESKSAGKHSVSFDASGLSTGIYFYTIQAGQFIQTKKMLLIK